MGDSPFRERWFAPADVRRILRRAAELAERDDATPAAERPLTQEEIERLGGDLGLPATSIQRAIAGDAELDAGTGLSQGARRLLFEDEIEGELPVDRHDDLVDAIQTVLGDAGRAQVVGRTLTWTPTPGYQNQMRALTVTVRTRDGRTRLRIDENLSQVHLGLHLGLGLGLGLGAGFGCGFPLALAMKSTLLGFGIVALAVLLSLALAQAIYWTIRKRKRRELRALRKRLRAVIAQGIAAPAAKRRARIAHDANRPAEAEEAEAEAEAVEERLPPSVRAGEHAARR